MYLYIALISLNTSGMNVTAGIDNERERVYQKAEQIDAQLQRMSEDLKVTTMKSIHKTNV